MKANELRIGNLVSWYNRPYPIAQIKENDACIEDLTNDFDQLHWLPVLKPILLTEDWLVKFGLIKKYSENQFVEGGFDLKEDGSRWYWWVDKGVFNLEIQKNGEIWFEVYSCYRHVKWVHELQNLYFALTGNELEYELGE